MTAPERRQWIDVAKGVCILLVVLWHVIMKHYLQVGWRLPVPLPGLWGTFGEQLLPLRMPVFFAISGMLAAGAVARTWSATARSRVAKFLYLYALWFGVHTAVLWSLPGFDTLAARGVADIVEQLTVTPTNLWYLMALAVYFVVARSTRTLPAVAVLLPAFALSAVAASGLLAAPGNRGQLYQNLLFFLAGVRFRPWIDRWARSATMRTFGTCVTAYLILVAVMRLAGAERWFGVWPLISGVAVAAGIAGAVQLARLRRLSGALAGLGRNTLPIYVIHMPLLALFDAALRGPFSGAGPAVQLALAVTLPVALTALLVLACLTLHRGALAAGGHWLFTLPDRRARPTSAQRAPVEQPTVEMPVLRPPAAQSPTVRLPIIRPVRGATAGRPAPGRHASGGGGTY
ncbi:acyltransferase family protein [Actinoplanes sp. NPDC023714]|uniref:acyltransferase family protein n=1 Tax=Actinoplanes sp. NPDC023714 TaxID=3154322 RepID=UPI0033FFA629